MIGPDDAGYDKARTVFPGGIDRRPAAIVRVADDDDVARVVGIAGETGLELAVRSGGHSGAGHGVCGGGIVLDLSDMRALDIDLEERAAWAETGLTEGEYTAAAATCGLATGFGDAGSVGIGGITLGGGVGYLVRKHGLTIDHLLAADVVTADGELLRVDADTHPGLFWGATVAHAGAGSAAERAIAPFRALATPLADTVRPMPYPDVFPPADDDLHPVATARTTFLDGVDRQAAETIVEHLQAATAPMAVAQLRVLGGAMARVPAEATAFAHRERRVMANVAAAYQRPDEAEPYAAWARGFAAELGRGTSGAYVGFLGDEGEARVRDAYPGSTWERLAAVKARYDPRNLFRLNQNVPPAAGGDGPHGACA